MRLLPDAAPGLAARGRVRASGHDVAVVPADARRPRRPRWSTRCATCCGTGIVGRDPPRLGRGPALVAGPRRRRASPGRPSCGRRRRRWWCWAPTRPRAWSSTPWWSSSRPRSWPRADARAAGAVRGPHPLHQPAGAGPRRPLPDVLGLGPADDEPVARAEEEAAVPDPDSEAPDDAVVDRSEPSTGSTASRGDDTVAMPVPFPDDDTVASRPVPRQRCRCRRCPDVTDAPISGHRRSRGGVDPRTAPGRGRRRGRGRGGRPRRPRSRHRRAVAGAVVERLALLSRVAAPAGGRGDRPCAAVRVAAADRRARAWPRARAGGDRRRRPRPPCVRPHARSGQPGSVRTVRLSDSRSEARFRAELGAWLDENQPAAERASDPPRSSGHIPGWAADWQTVPVRRRLAGAPVAGRARRPRGQRRSSR